MQNKIILAADQPRCSFLLYLFGKLWMTLGGWKISGTIPAGGKFVLVCAPHTSNWDFILLKAAMGVFRLDVKWMGKHTLFKAPFGRLFKWLGGIPIERSQHHGMVEQTVHHFEKHDKLIVAIPPSGTRSKRSHWKSGFYWIAYQGKIPLLFGSLDYKKKIAHISMTFVPSGDVKADMDKVRAFYQGVSGQNPENASDIRLKEEDL